MKHLLILVQIIVLVFSMGCSNHLRKVKSSELYKKSAMQERFTLSHEEKLKKLEKNGMVMHSDSSNYWVWFQSANPFQFHPDRGLVAENGELLLGGNNRKIAFVHENIILLENEWKDSSTSDKAILAEKEVLKSLDKEQKINVWLLRLGWGLMLLVAGVAVWFIGTRKNFTFFK